MQKTVFSLLFVLFFSTVVEAQPKLDALLFKIKAPEIYKTEFITSGEILLLKFTGHGRRLLLTDFIS